jgi:hypothetical protein
VSDLSEDKEMDYSLWKATNYLKRPKNHVQPICKDDGTWARDNIQKAKLFAEHLANTFQPHLRQTADEYFPKINNKNKAKIKPVTPTEVLKEIAKHLSSKKAPGYYLIQ